MEMTTPSTCTYTLVPIGLSLLFAQHAGLFYASTSTYSDLDLCLPRKYKKAWRGWQQGICYTEEQLWCRQNNNRHTSCADADCRAEEIRLSLFLRDGLTDGNLLQRKPVYDQSGKCFYQIYDHLMAMNEQLASRTVGACVPAEDRLARYLPHCPVEIARCRTIYYQPWPEGLRGQCNIDAPYPNINYEFFRADTWHNRKSIAFWHTGWQAEWHQIMANGANGTNGKITMSTGYIVYR